MGAWGSLVWATFREGVRNKVFYNLFFFGLLIILVSLILNQMTVGDSTKIIKDLGLTCISVFGLLIAVFVGTNLIYQEFREKIIYTVLAKPVLRETYLLGKFMGVTILIFLNGLIMAVLVWFLLLSAGGTPDWSLFKAVYLIQLELSLVFAMVIFFSTFMKPQVSIFSVLIIFVIGHSTSEARTLFGSHGHQMLKKITDIIYYILPNFDHFNIKTQVVHNLSLHPHHLLWTTCYGLFYSTLILILAGVIFRKREF